jgi:hypothetical protein
MFDDNTFNETITGYGRNFMPGGFNGEVTIVSIGQKTPDKSYKGTHSFFCSYTTTNGKEYSWVQTIPEKDGVQKERSRAISTIKGFLSAVVGAAEFEKANHADVYRLATSEANPFAGTRLGLHTKEKKMKNGGDFTVHDWHELTTQ